MVKTTRSDRMNARQNNGEHESEHSHIEYTSGQTNWDRGTATDFAITTVNVPDRLDTQEVRARAAVDTAVPSVRRFHRSDFVRAAGWLFALLVAGAVLWGAARAVTPLQAAITPAGISALVSRALGVPVTVRETEVRLLPSPSLIVRDMFFQPGFRVPEITIHFNWRDALRSLQSATWVFGEARVSALRVSGDEAWAMLQSIRGAGGLPAAVSTVRFESVEFADLVLLPGRYEAVLRRGVGQREFAALQLKRLDVEGQVDLEITPPAAPGSNAKFALFGSRWAAAVGPTMNWNEATAQGEFRADLVRVDSFSAGAPFGTVNGVAVLEKGARGWRLSGNLRGPDISIEALTRFAAGAGSRDDGSRAPVPLLGTARLGLAVSGAGQTAGEALQRATAGGSASVSGAVINGLNLGLAATQGDLTGARGATRFSDLDLELVASSGGLAVRNLVGKAGSLRVYGGFSVDRSLQLRGSLRSDVSSPRGVASSDIRLGGTAIAPEFSQ